MRARRISRILLLAGALLGAVAAHADDVPGVVPGTFSALLAQAFAWIDNGRRIGIITFSANGTAFDTWSPAPNTWRMGTNGDLLITNAGRNYVTRLTFDGAGGFHGQRDATSQVQDGVQTVLQKLPSQRVDLD
jgi:hypothetical protein